jgi:hypothetical protein
MSYVDAAVAFLERAGVPEPDIGAILAWSAELFAELRGRASGSGGHNREASAGVPHVRVCVGAYQNGRMRVCLYSGRAGEPFELVARIGDRLAGMSMEDLSPEHRELSLLLRRATKNKCEVGFEWERGRIGDRETAATVAVLVGWLLDEVANQVGSGP